MKYFTVIILPKWRQKLAIDITEASFTFRWWIRMYFFPALFSGLVLYFAQIIVSSRYLYHEFASFRW